VGMDKRKMSEMGSWILVVCAVATTGLVVRREFAQVATVTEPKREPVYLEGWERALAIGTRSGSATAPVQVVEFADFQCPACARFDATVQMVLQEHPEKVAFTLVHFPIPFHDSADAAARSAECAHSQGRFNAMRSALFEKQDLIGSVPWTEFGKEAGIPDLSLFEACVSNTQPLEQVENGKKLGEAMNVRGTPTILVNGWKLPFTPSPADFDNIVEGVARGKSPADIERT
jgi:protein-disulfide isomerase